MIKFIFSVILVILLFWLTTTLSANYKDNDLQESIKQLEALKSWDKFKIKIDSFIKKYENNKDILNKFQRKLYILEDKLKNKTDKKSRLLKIMVRYLIIKVYFALDNLLKEEEIKKDIFVKEEEVKKQLIFPGFSDKYNDFDKNILAGEEVFVYEWWAWAFYEKAKVSGVRFYIVWDNISDLKYTINKSYLYVDGLLLKTASYGDIDILSSTRASITFNNIDNFILPTDTNLDFRLSIKTNNIWYEQVWKTMKNLKVSEVDFFDVTGLTTWDFIVKTEISNVNSEYFSILPSILNIEVIKNLYKSNHIELNIKSISWSNITATSKATPLVELNKIQFSVWWTNSNTSTYTLYNKDNSSDIVIGVYNSWIVEFDLSSLTWKIIWWWQGENYIINISWIDNSIWIELLKKWIIYSIDWISNSDNLNINLEKNIDLGYRDF